jgi:hypothetical protein
LRDETGKMTHLERCAEVLVDDLGLVVSLVLLAGLLLETEPLVEGVVQLGVGVDDFPGGVSTNSPLG